MLWLKHYLPQNQSSSAQTHPPELDEERTSDMSTSRHRRPCIRSLDSRTSSPDGRAGDGGIRLLNARAAERLTGRRVDGRRGRRSDMDPGRTRLATIDLGSARGLEDIIRLAET